LSQPVYRIDWRVAIAKQHRQIMAGPLEAGAITDTEVTISRPVQQPQPVLGFWDFPVAFLFRNQNLL